VNLTTAKEVKVGLTSTIHGFGVIKGTMVLDTTK